MILITVNDVIGNTWSNPVVAQNVASAKRDFMTACKDDRSMMGQHPLDFRLYALADWLPSLEDGKLPILRVYDNPKFLMQGEINGDKA
jgi:hypothetical protein